jgi:RNase P/RNase MRP subunit p29
LAADEYADMDLYTKNGRPLQVSGDTIFSRSGTVIGRISGDKVYGTDGRYVGTIDGDRLVYRSTDRATIGSPFTTANIAGFARASYAGSAIWGDEPDIPD